MKHFSSKLMPVLIFRFPFPQYALRKLYHESPRLICVLYTSPTCGPCRTLKPILGKVCEDSHYTYLCKWLISNLLNFCCFHKWQVIDEFDENVHFVEIDIEEDPEIAEAAGIMGTPCVQFFKNKEMIRSAKFWSFIHVSFPLCKHIIIIFYLLPSLCAPHPKLNDSPWMYSTARDQLIGSLSFGDNIFDIRRACEPFTWVSLCWLGLNSGNG